MYSNVSADVSATLNKVDIIELLEEGEISTGELTLKIAEPERKEAEERLAE